MITIWEPQLVFAVGAIFLASVSMIRSRSVPNRVPRTPVLTPIPVEGRHGWFSQWRDRRLGHGAVVIGVAWVLGWQLAAAGVLVIWLRPIYDRRQQARRRDQMVAKELPQIVDLFVVALQAGNNVTTATRRVAEVSEGPVSEALQAGLQLVDGSGVPLADALETLPAEVGPAVRPLVGALVAAERWGVPVADSLTQIATEVRTQRRRQAEAAARRLPVQMLFPLVTCVLPAFGLLTVVPVLVDSLRTLSW